MTLAANRHYHFIHEPRVAKLPATLSEFIRVVGVELRTLQANSLARIDVIPFG